MERRFYVQLDKEREINFDFSMLPAIERATGYNFTKAEAKDFNYDQIYKILHISLSFQDPELTYDEMVKYINKKNVNQIVEGVQDAMVVAYSPDEFIESYFKFKEQLRKAAEEQKDALKKATDETIRQMKKTPQKKPRRKKTKAPRS